MEQFLSNRDIKSLVPDVKIILYSDLNNIDSIEQLLPKQTSKVCILYETQKPINNTAIGHWVCMFKTKHDQQPYLEFFDPYGTYPDNELISTIYKGPRILNELMIDYMDRGGRVQYNDYPFQSYKKNINTCGKHCVMRMKNADIDIDLYKDFIDILKPIYNNKSDKCDRIVNDFYQL